MLCRTTTDAVTVDLRGINRVLTSPDPLAALASGCLSTTGLALALLGEGLTSTAENMEWEESVDLDSETVLARLLVLITATGLAVSVAALAMALDFRPASWPPVIAALLLTGLIYAAIGALAGALLDKLAATYLILFLVMSDLSVVQAPMFHATPGRFAALLPGYGPTRVMLEGAYSQTFNADSELLLALAWAATLAFTAYFVLRRRLGVRA